MGGQINSLRGNGTKLIELVNEHIEGIKDILNNNNKTNETKLDSNKNIPKDREVSAFGINVSNEIADIYDSMDDMNMKDIKKEYEAINPKIPQHPISNINCNTEQQESEDPLPSILDFIDKEQ